MMLETELYAERVLARQGVGISEAFGIGSAVPGDGEEILSLEIYSPKPMKTISGPGIMHPMFPLRRSTIPTARTKVLSITSSRQHWGRSCLLPTATLAVRCGGNRRCKK